MGFVTCNRMRGFAPRAPGEDPRERVLCEDLAGECCCCLACGARGSRHWQAQAQAQAQKQVFSSAEPSAAPSAGQQLSYFASWRGSPSNPLAQRPSLYGPGGGPATHNRVWAGGAKY